MNKEYEKIYLISKIKQHIFDIDMWQKYIIRWQSFTENENIRNSIKEAQIRLNLHLVKIKELIREFENVKKI